MNDGQEAFRCKAEVRTAIHETAQRIGVSRSAVMNAIIAKWLCGKSDQLLELIPMADDDKIPMV